MTIKEKILAKIDELNLIKDSLIKLESFNDPDNEAHIYHTKGISDISGFTGSTPNNLSELLGVLTEKINSYVTMISGLPNIESSIIYRDRGIHDFAIVSDAAHIPIPVVWEKVSEGVSFGSVQQQLPVSSYTGSLNQIEIESVPSCRKGGVDSVDIEFEIVVIRINPRKNILEEYVSGNGSIQIIIDSDHLFGDDVFIVGFRPIQPIISTSIYYINFSYKVKMTNTEGVTMDHIYTIADTSIGNNILDCDPSLTSGIVMWDMLTLNDFSVGYESSIGQNGTIMPIPQGSDLGGREEGNIIELLSVLNMKTNIEDKVISCRSGISKRRELIREPYSIYNKNENGISHIVIKNVRPIDLVLEEVLSAL